MRRFSVLVLTGILMAAGVQNASADVFYVSPTGDNANPGTLALPWQTLAGARDNLRTGGHLDGFGDITVFFRDGTYVFSDTVVFDKADDGTADQVIAYAAMPGEAPIFTSLVQVTGPWTDFPGSSGIGIASTMQADLPAGISHVRYLQDASENWMERSATARFSTTEDAGGFDGQCVECNWDTPETQPDRLNIQYPGSFTPPDWTDASQFDLRQSSLPWNQEVLPIQSVDEPNSRIHTTVPACFDMREDIMERPPQAWVLNSTDGIDQAGEWASLNGKIILLPRSGTGDIFVPQLIELVRIDDGTANGNAAILEPVQYITFRGITFTGGDFRITEADDITGQHDWNVVDEPDALLRIRNAANITVADCIFTKSGGTGIRADRYAQNILIDGNELSYLGKSGIVFTGRGPGHGDVNTNNEIRNNRLERTGMEKWAAPAIVIDQSSNNYIHHNIIENTFYTGIALIATRQLAVTSWVEGNNTSYLGREFHFFEIAPSVVTEAAIDADAAMQHLYNHNNRVEENALIDVSEGQDMFLNGKIYISGVKKDQSNFVRRNYFYDSFNHSANDYAWYSDSDQDACEYTGNMVNGVLNDDAQPESTPLILVFNIWAETNTVGTGTILLRANATLDSTFSENIDGGGNRTEQGNVVDPIGAAGPTGGIASQVGNYQQSYRAICPGNIAGEELPGAEEMQTSLASTITGLSGVVPSCPPRVSRLESIPSTLAGLTEGEPITVPITQLIVEFNQGMVDPGGDSAANDVTNPANYLLVESGANGIHQTGSCAVGTAGDDVATAISSVVYNMEDREATLTLGATPAGGFYRLFVCATLENENMDDLDGNGDGTGGDDFLRTFSVRDSDSDGVLDGEDAVCSGVNLVLKNLVFQSGETLACTATASISTELMFAVNSGAEVTLNAPTTNLASGVSVSGRLTVRD